MARLTWTPQAIDDIEAICEFIAKDAPRYGQVFATQVLNAEQKIKTFPMASRIVPEVDRQNIREIIIGEHFLNNIAILSFRAEREILMNKRCYTELSLRSR